MSESQNDHFEQKPRRRAEFIKPPNTVKAKVGSGGLSESLLNKAQQILENNTTDFAPLAEMYLTSLQNAIDQAKVLVGFQGDHEMAITAMIYPAMQLKANGAMFHFPIVTLLADKKVQFLEVIESIDQDVIDLSNAFIVTIRAVLASQIREHKHPQGQELLSALDGACRRYFTRHPENKNPL
jgi:hypothetical protein